MTLEVSEPRASEESELPGYTRPRSPTFLPSLFRISHLLLTFIVILLFLCPVSEGCLPSWFRHERSDPPEPLTGHDNTILGKSLENSHYAVPTKKPPHNFFSNAIDAVKHLEENMITEFEDLYEEAKPLIIDQRLEEARQRFMVDKCKDFCLRNGTCHVEVDESSLEFVSKHCSCPPYTWGNRCELNYSPPIFASAISKGFNTGNSTIPVLAFAVIVVMLSIGLLVYTFQRVSRTADGNGTSSRWSAYTDSQHLRRSTISRTSTSIDVSSRLNTNGVRAPFSPSPRRYHRLAVNWPGQPVLPGCVSLPIHNNNTTTSINQTPQQEVSQPLQVSQPSTTPSLSQLKKDRRLKINGRRAPLSISEAP